MRPGARGFGLLRMLLRRMRGDFQDLSSWRAGALEVLRESFARRRLDDCLSRLSSLPADQQLWTDHLTVQQTAEAVAQRVGVGLEPRSAPLTAAARRWWISASHIRLL